jgi:hypothetical protein
VEYENALMLWREIRQTGYPETERQVLRWLQHPSNNPTGSGFSFSISYRIGMSKPSCDLPSTSYIKCGRTALEMCFFMMGLSGSKNPA